MSDTADAWDKFQADRLALLTSSYNEQAFRDYLVKYDESPPLGTPARVLEAGWHYARLNFDLMSPQAKQESESWLRRNGYNPYPARR